ncbi:hypothetical protein C7U60_06525 [Mesorhizobium plurifarium]|nr:hypothetical protein C7U60_06525 [Mesorhizobium plurifarium]
MAGYGDNDGFTAYATEAGYVFPDDTTDAQKTAARRALGTGHPLRGAVDRGTNPAAVCAGHVG